MSLGGGIPGPPPPCMKPWGGKSVRERERERESLRKDEIVTERISFNGTVELTSFCIIRPDRIQTIFMGERERGVGEREGDRTV